jgi:nucleoside-diphosphate-sugar epimerase
VKELMMRVFLAGATGAIGRQLVPGLVAAGHEVHGMTRSESKQAMLDELGAVPTNPLCRAVFSLFAKTMRAKRGLLEDGGAELGE